MSWTPRVGAEDAEGIQFGSIGEINRRSGKSIAEADRELRIHDSSLGNWVRQDQVNRVEREGLASDERAELAELLRENRLRVEGETLKASCGLVGKPSSSVAGAGPAPAPRSSGPPTRSPRATPDRTRPRTGRGRVNDHTNPPARLKGQLPGTSCPLDGPPPAQT